MNFLDDIGVAVIHRCAPGKSSTMKLLTDTRLDREAFAADFGRACRGLVRALGRNPNAANATAADTALTLVAHAKRSVLLLSKSVGAEDGDYAWWDIEVQMAIVWLDIIVARWLDRESGSRRHKPECLDPHDAEMFVVAAQRVAAELVGRGALAKAGDAA